jgi:hypothetical protein
MSFLDAREHGSKVGSGGHASAQNEVRAVWMNVQMEDGSALLEGFVQ